MKAKKAFKKVDNSVRSVFESKDVMTHIVFPFAVSNWQNLILVCRLFKFYGNNKNVKSLVARVDKETTSLVSFFDVRHVGCQCVLYGEYKSKNICEVQHKRIIKPNGVVEIHGYTTEDNELQYAIDVAPVPSEELDEVDMRKPLRFFGEAATNHSVCLMIWRKDACKSFYLDQQNAELIFSNDKDRELKKPKKKQIEN